MASPQSVAARNSLGFLLDNYPVQGEKVVSRITSMAAEIATLQDEILADPDDLYDPGDIGLLNQVRADVKSAIQQAAANI